MMEARNSVMLAFDSFAISLVWDSVAVRTRDGDAPVVTWLRLADGEVPFVGAFMALCRDGSGAVLAQDGMPGPFYPALSGRVPAGTSVSIKHPAGVPADSTA